MASSGVHGVSAMGESAAGSYDPNIKSDISPILNKEAFVDQVLATRDEPQVSDDEDLSYFSHGVIAHIHGKCIKFGPCFTSNAQAQAHADKVSMDGLLPTGTMPLYEWVPFGPPPVPEARDILGSFVDDFNMRHSTMQGRVEAVRAHNKRTQDQPEGAADDTPPPSPDQDPAPLVSAPLHLQPDPAPLESSADEAETQKITQKLEKAITRGDTRKHFVHGQGYMVLGHIKSPSGHWLLRYCGVFGDAESARDLAKKLFAKCPGNDRFDYLVAKLHSWKPFPIDFMSGIKDIQCTNPNVQRFYEASNFRASEEYKDMLDEVNTSAPDMDTADSPPTETGMLEVD